MLALLILSILPRDAGVLRETVDIVEVNSFYDDDDNSELVFVQNIYRDWQGDERVDIRAWRLLKSESMHFIRDFSTGYYYAIWMDGEIMRCVYAKSITYSFTQYDPELTERKFLPKDDRKELRPNPKPARPDPPAGAIRPKIE